MDVDLRIRVLLSVQRALVGEITPAMRYVAVEFSPESIHILIWHDGAVPSSVTEGFDAGAVTQVVADFSYPEQQDPQVSFEFVRCDSPQRPEIRGTLVYGRSEQWA